MQGLLQKIGLETQKHASQKSSLATGHVNPKSYDKIHNETPTWPGIHPHPIRIYFMGLFDTVASIGATTGLNQYAGYAPLVSPLAGVALNLPDGHMDWENDLRIPHNSNVRYIKIKVQRPVITGACVTNDIRDNGLLQNRHNYQDTSI